MRESVLLNPGITQNFCKIYCLTVNERFFSRILDNQHRVIRHEEMFTGTISSVEVHPREIVREALKVNAAALIWRIIIPLVRLNRAKLTV